MDKMVKAVINGTERDLNYSIEVMFDANEKFGSIKNALEIMDKDNKEAFEAVKWFAIHMANDAELARRDEGYDNNEMLNDDSITPHMKVYEFADLKQKVCDAIVIGYGREIDDAEKKEVDLGLQELNSKKTKARGKGLGITTSP